MKISSRLVGDYKDENSFPYKLLLTNTQVSKLRKAVVNSSSAIIKNYQKLTCIKCGSQEDF